MIFGKKNNNRGLRIIIVGCGKVGITLVEELTAEGHNITIIDKNSDKINALTGLYDIMGIVGNGASYSIQMEAGITKADLIIAVTNSDELNLLCCTVAKKIGDCAAIARVRTPDYSSEVGYLREKLGLTMIINPEFEMAKEAARILYLPTALEVSPFAHGQIEMTKLIIPDKSTLDGKTIATMGKNMDKNITDNLNICAVEREGEVFIPSGMFELHSGDIISYVASRKVSREFLKHLGVKTTRVKNTMIIGGGRAAYYLANQLIHMGIDVKIIEQDEKRCDELAELLPKAVIIHGDGTDESILKEEGIETCESFVPLTGIDEENVMLTLYAKQVSKAKVVTKINRMTFKSVINNMQLDSVIYPKYITSDAIIAYVRARSNSTNSNIETMYHMFESRVEAIEFKVTDETKVTGTALKDLSIKKNTLISFINRKGQMIVPSGQDTIEVGDSVMVVTTNSGFTNITDILL